MGFPIPKIEYGGFIPSVILFDYPPKEDSGEILDSKERATASLAGKRQVSVDHIEATRELKFSFLSESVYNDLRNFFLGHGFIGKTFKYFDDKTLPDFVNYELKSLQFRPRKIAGAGANEFVWEVPLVFRRVTDDVGGDVMEADINNNQVTPLAITGMVLDSSKYKSAKVFFELFRKTDSEERVANGWITATFKISTGAWDVTTGGTYDGDDHGLVLDITASGQVRYTSDNMAGTNYVGKIRFKNFTFET